MKDQPTSTPPLRLECESCKRSRIYDRSIDPGILASVVLITQPSCDDCWDGDREGETWYDAEGNEVSQYADVVGQPSTPGASSQPSESAGSRTGGGE